LPIIRGGVILSTLKSPDVGSIGFQSQELPTVDFRCLIEFNNRKTISGSNAVILLQLLPRVREIVESYFVGGAVPCQDHDRWHNLLYV